KTKVFNTGNSSEKLILEHLKVPFILNPCEYTNEMYWETAVMFIKLSRQLYKNYQLLTSDAHPWNMSYFNSKPIFFDFSSLYKGNNISLQWIEEFERYFAVPIKLASFSKTTYPYSLEYRREHILGIGKSLSKIKWVRKFFL